ncbi:MAG: hypothetical protein AAGH38_07345 [Pseudomonadota bacterium]
MASFRFLAWLLIGLSIALLGADAVSSMEEKVPVIRTTAEFLEKVGIDARQAATSAPAAIADGVNVMVDLPLWSIIGVLGLVLAVIFRPIR